MGKAHEFILPPSPYAEAHERAMELYRRMSKEERLASLVRAGVFNEDGTLAERFRCLVETDETEASTKD